MKMPQSVMAGVYHRFNDPWAILGSVGGMSGPASAGSMWI
jgi:hypothetical protein